ncbi:hypothetical protein KR200_007102, partial [Drosophila serrata]
SSLHSDPVFSSGFVRREFNDSGIADGKLRTISTSSCATTMSTETDHDRASLLTGEYRIWCLLYRAFLEPKSLFFFAGYSRKSSVDSAGGSLYGTGSRSSSLSSSASDCSDSGSQPDIHSLCSEDDCQEVLRQILQHDQPVQISIKLHVTEDQYTNWNTILNPVNNLLYVALPKNLPPAGSKQTFISLLEFAEDKLEVDGIVMAMAKDQPDRARLVEAFLFMGFEPLSRKAPQAPPGAINDNENNYFFYNIEE